MNPKRKDVSFSTGDLVFLKVSPMKGVMRFGKKGKLVPRYIGPFEIRSRVGEVAYRLVLPPELSRIHPVFYMSMSRKYIVLGFVIPNAAKKQKFYHVPKPRIHVIRLIDCLGFPKPYQERK